MPLYVLQEGRSCVFRLGRTLGSRESLLEQLRASGSPQPQWFEWLETEDDRACEAFLYRHLQARRVDAGSGRACFEVEAEGQVRHAVYLARVQFQALAKLRQQVNSLAQQESSDLLLEPEDEDRQLLKRLNEIKEEQEYLACERELIEGRLKSRIGGAAGIRGLATWKTHGTRRYSEELFRRSQPDHYRALLRRYYCLDTRRWKADDPDDYRRVQTTYFTPSVCRLFKLP